MTDAGTTKKATSKSKNTKGTTVRQRDAEKGTKKSKKPVHKRDANHDDKQEQSTATASTKGPAKKNRNKSKSPNVKDQGTARKEKKMASREEEAPDVPQEAATALSTVSTVSETAPAAPPVLSLSNTKTPPQKTNLGSTRKVKGGTTPTTAREAPNHPPPSVKHPVTTPTEKWLGETTAKNWMDKADFAKAKNDFEKLQSMTVNVEKECKKWAANAKWNQSEEYPALDSTLVKLEDNAYFNMSQVDIGLGRPILMAQLPLKDSEESFWKAVFEKRTTFIDIILGSETIEFFPQKAEDYKTYGQMWINNRRVEHVNEDISRFWIEVLPQGCSNSIVCIINVIKNWMIDSVHAKHSVVIKETIELTTFLGQATPDETALVVSQHGAGRAGYFLALTVAVQKLETKSEPCIADIVKTIRGQRPKAVETLTQYASLYISLFYFIKKKVAKPVEGGDKKAATADPVCKKSVELTQLFTNALIAEATQPSQMGTTTTTLGSTVMSLATSGPK